MGTLDATSIAIIAFVFIADVFLITVDRRNKLIFQGKNKYKIIMPITVIIFMVLTFVSSSYKILDIIVLIGLLPLAFVGNKCGITEKGLLTNSYVTPWDKIESYSLEEKEGKCILKFSSLARTRKIFFKLEDKDEIKKYLLGVKQLRYRKK